MTQDTMRSSFPDGAPIPRRYGILARVVLSGVFLLLLLVTAEWFVRLAWYRHEVCGWKALKAPRQETNQCGFRGQPVAYTDEDYVILLVGDSQVEAVACTYAGMPERRLEHYLNTMGRRVRVFTLGAGGYGQDQELLALQEYYRKYRADLVLVWFTPINDIWDNMFPTHWPKNGPAKPTFWLENGRLCGPNHGFGPVPCEGSRIVDILRRRFIHADKDGEWERQHLPRSYAPLVGYSGPTATNLQALWDANLGGFRGDSLDNEKSRRAIFLTPRSARMAYGLDLTRRLLLEMQKLVTARNGSLDLFWPVIEDDLPAPGTEHVERLNGKDYRVSRQQYDANLAEIARGFRLVNVPVTMKDHAVGPADTHLNERAVDEVMRELAATLHGAIPTRRGAPAATGTASAKIADGDHG